MIREEILALEDLELRKAVAKAKGYRVEQVGMYYFGRPRRHPLGETVPAALLEPGYALIAPRGERESPGIGDVCDDQWTWAPEFESDIEAAWPLLESLPSWHMYRSVNSNGVIVEWRETACFARTEGKTAMQAICRAYLLAKVGER